MYWKTWSFPDPNQVVFVMKPNQAINTALSNPMRINGVWKMYTANTSPPYNKTAYQPQASFNQDKTKL